MTENVYVLDIEGAITHQGSYLLIVRGAEEEHAAGMLSLVGGGVDKDLRMVTTKCNLFAYVPAISIAVFLQAY